jgi:transcriptional regulator with XRE-family HTH domain
MKDPEYRAAYDESAKRIRAIDQVVRALEEQRERQGITKAELARRAGLPPEAVRRLFSSMNANPTLGTVTALASALDVEIVLKPLAAKA